MDENVLLDWKEAHADVYSKFKQDLEGQLQKPYHQVAVVSVLAVVVVPVVRFSFKWHCVFAMRPNV